VTDDAVYAGTTRGVTAWVGRQAAVGVRVPAGGGFYSCPRVAGARAHRRDEADISTASTQDRQTEVGVRRGTADLPDARRLSELGLLRRREHVAPILSTRRRAVRTGRVPAGGVTFGHDWPVVRRRRAWSCSHGGPAGMCIRPWRNLPRTTRRRRRRSAKASRITPPGGALSAQPEDGKEKIFVVPATSVFTPVLRRRLSSVGRTARCSRGIMPRKEHSRPADRAAGERPPISG